MDSCDAYKSLHKAEKRSTGFYVDWTSDDPITDETLKEDWYRVISDNGEDMAISPPGLKFCGTTNPIWFNGMQTICFLCRDTIFCFIFRFYILTIRLSF